MKSSYIKFIFFSINLLILSFLVLADPRGSVLSDPHTQTIAPISVALSYLLFDIKGWVGLKEVFSALLEPTITDYASRYIGHLGGFVVDFKNIAEVETYRDAITQNFEKVKSLNVLDEKNVITLWGDVGYVIFTFISFFLFGVSVKSISLFFIFITVISSLIFMIAFHKNNFIFFILQTLIFSYTLVIIGNYGGSIQTFSMTNYRFSSVLTLIPTIHLIFLILDNKNLSKYKIILAFVQLIILLFLCFVRGTSLWGFLFILLFYFSWIVLIGLKNLKLYKRNIITMGSIIFSFIIIFNLTNNIIEKNLSYKLTGNTTIDHPFWHAAFLGLAIHPVVYEKYVCSDEKLDDFKTIQLKPCGVYPQMFPEYSKFYKEVVFYQARDYFGYNAAVTFLHRNNINEKIGVEDVKNNYQSGLNEVDWQKYEKIIKTVYFDFLLNNPLEYLYIHLILKPIRVLYEVIKFPFYFLNAFKLNTLFIFLIFLSSLSILTISNKMFKIKEDFENLKNKNHIHIFKIFFTLLILLLAAPSIFFYTSAQSGTAELTIGTIIFLIFLVKTRIEKTSI